jgi:hypothetical protein
MCEAGRTSPEVQADISASLSARPAFVEGSRERIQMQHGVPMRDLVADWKKWSRAERVLAVIGTLLMLCCRSDC